MDKKVKKVEETINEQSKPQKKFKHYYCIDNFSVPQNVFSVN